MKSLFKISIILLLLPSCASLDSANKSSVQTQQQAEEVYTNIFSLMKSEDEAQGMQIINFVNDYPDLADPMVYFRAADWAERSSKIDDAIFYYEAANSRALLDMEVCQPVPETAQRALRGIRLYVGSKLNILDRDINFDALSSRYEKWQLTPGEYYKRGWQCSAINNQQLQASSSSVKDKKLKLLKIQATLFKDADYLNAARTAKRYYSLPEKTRDQTSEVQKFNAAKDIIISKEKELGEEFMTRQLVEQ